MSSSDGTPDPPKNRPGSRGPPRSSLELPSREFFVETIWPRVTFEGRSATQAIVFLILSWYLFQLGAMFAGWDSAKVQWFFTTDSFPAFSPGLVLAAISHAFPPATTHVLGNVAMLWIFAGESEQHMGRMEVLAFFAVIAVASVNVGTMVSVKNTLGASGGALAFISFYSVHHLLEHRNDLMKQMDDYGKTTNETLRVVVILTAVLSPWAIGIYTIGQQIGLISAGNVDIVGHLTGLLLGAGYAFGRANTHLIEPECGQSPGRD